MFNSAIAILGNYIEKVTPYNLHSVEMARGENNWDELYYLCEVGDEFYVVLETDYVDTTPYYAKEVAEIFGSDNLQIEGWMVRRDRITGNKLIAPDVSPGDKAFYDALVTPLDGSYLKQAVLKMISTNQNKHYNPGAYGHAD